MTHNLSDDAPQIRLCDNQNLESRFPSAHRLPREAMSPSKQKAQPCRPTGSTPTRSPRVLDLHASSPFSTTPSRRTPPPRRTPARPQPQSVVHRSLVFKRFAVARRPLGQRQLDITRVLPYRPRDPWVTPGGPNESRLLRIDQC